jgi:hypothetical protein
MPPVTIVHDYTYISVGLAYLFVLAALIIIDTKRTYGLIRTTGQVIDLKEGWGKRGKVFNPVISFRDGANRQWTVEGRLSVNNSKVYAVGEKIIVLYDPINPSKITFNPR